MANVIMGEAPETDDELEEDSSENGATPSKKFPHVDERVQQFWKHLSSDIQTVLWRRNQPVVKIIRQQKELTYQSFNSIQSAASSLRLTAAHLLQIEDNLTDIEQAASLLPSNYSKSFETLKIL